MATHEEFYIMDGRVNSRFCRKCDAVFRYQCKCNPRMAMAWQRTNVFHQGKRNKGKAALKYTQNKDEGQE